ncbi:hypothetical protein HHX47_DHR6000233 [Lentinula edodes]|nr:hypothetical protein HHX47_DHR6000233 [Lentinula edodes]
MPRGIPNAKRDDTGIKYTTFHVLVIHLGSRFSRIGRASDVTPVTVPTVVARRCKTPVTPHTFIEGIARPRAGKKNLRPSEKSLDQNEYEVSTTSDDPFEEKIAAITTSLRDRMRFYKLRVTPNAANIASTFNGPFRPEIIAEHNDPYRVDWISSSTDEEVLVGDKVGRGCIYQFLYSNLSQALRLADPQSSSFIVRWPIYGSKFNTRDYTSSQVVLSDIETLLRYTLHDKFAIEPRDYGESLAATYGAGISTACVVDIGAKTTSIACVDEGLVVADSRMSLNIGGDDITEFLYVLLERISFPYKDINLANSYDWNVMEDLKARLCTLMEVDVALNLYDFVVRKPGSPAEKYGLRAYDEIILAPMGSLQNLIADKTSSDAGPTLGTSSNIIVEGSIDVPMEVIDIELEDNKSSGPQQSSPSKSARRPSSEPVQPFPGSFGVDVCFEASKLPLDVAIFNSARASGGDEKIRKYLQAVLVIGGTARISGMGHALESRLQAIATPLVQNMERVQIIPPPKDVDHRVLAWKGGAVLGKMDGAAELWVTQQDWGKTAIRSCIHIVRQPVLHKGKQTGSHTVRYVQNWLKHQSHDDFIMTVVVAPEAKTHLRQTVEFRTWLE